MNNDNKIDEIKTEHELEESSESRELKAQIKQLRDDELGIIQASCKKLRDAVDELSRIEYGLPGFPSIYLEGKNLKSAFPEDAEIQEGHAQLNLLIEEYKRLSVLSYNQQSLFEDQFRDLHFKLLTETKEGFLQTASYFEKLAVLAVAILGASISGLMAVVAHLPAGRALSGHSLLIVNFILYIVALAIALVGQFCARFQADKTLRRLVSKAGNAALKKSAFLLLHSEEQRKEEYERLKKDEDSNNHQDTLIYRVTSILSLQGGVLPSVGFIITMLIAIYITASILLSNIA